MSDFPVSVSGFPASDFPERIWWVSDFPNEFGGCLTSRADIDREYTSILHQETYSVSSPAMHGLCTKSVRNLSLRADRALVGSPSLCDEIEAIRHRPKTENRP